MKKIYLTLLLLIIFGLNSYSQTTLTEDANGILNTGRVVAQTGGGQNFFVGHQLGASYANGLAIFSAQTDNPTGSNNYFYDGITNGVTNFRVRADGQGYFAGNLGISTPTPAAFLDLGSSPGIKQLVYGSGGDIGYYMGFGVDLGQAPNTLSVFIGPSGGDGTNGDASFSVVSATSQWPYSAYTTRFTVLASGNVLIGEASQKKSSYKLDVGGNVRANQITVNSTGADFVFEPTYHLIPLSTLKTYLDQNHHLPEIASAKEMQSDGLNLGENQTKLLQKVEELTLYLIDKDNEVKSQATQLKSQQEEINQLKQQMESLIKASQKK